MPLRILFVCHGNICRSPMAEFVMKELLREAGLSERFEIASAATSTEELGNPVYPPARAELKRHGLDPAGKFARRMTKEDYGKYDLLIAMDLRNLRNMKPFCGEDPEHKIHLLAEYAGKKGGEISDPWYSGDFGNCYREIREGCEALLKYLTSVENTDPERNKRK